MWQGWIHHSGTIFEKKGFIILAMSNLTKCMEVRFPKDVQKIREAVPLMFKFSDVEIEHAWELFSDSYCAQWLNVHDETLRQFKDWLEE